MKHNTMYLPLPYETRVILDIKPKNEKKCLYFITAKEDIQKYLFFIY